MKKIIIYSLLGAALLFNGCGGIQNSPPRSDWERNLRQSVIDYPACLTLQTCSYSGDGFNED